jgi:hypothetical protein
MARIEVNDTHLDGGDRAKQCGVLQVPDLHQVQPSWLCVDVVVDHRSDQVAVGVEPCLGQADVGGLGLNQGANHVARGVDDPRGSVRLGRHQVPIGAQGVSPTDVTPRGRLGSGISSPRRRAGADG